MNTRRPARIPLPRLALSASLALSAALTAALSLGLDLPFALRALDQPTVQLSALVTGPLCLLVIGLSLLRPRGGLAPVSLVAMLLLLVRFSVLLLAGLDRDRVEMDLVLAEGLGLLLPIAVGWWSLVPARAGAFFRGGLDLGLALLQGLAALGMLVLAVLPLEEGAPTRLSRLLPEPAPLEIPEPVEETAPLPATDTGEPEPPPTIHLAPETPVGVIEEGEPALVEEDEEEPEEEEDEPRSRKSRCDKDDPRIRQLSPGRWAVRRGLIERYTSDLDAASRLASVSWHKGRDGRRDGFLIQRLRCTSPLYEAGFRRGDVVHEVNGHRVRNVAGGVAAVARLRSKDQISVQLSRKGKKRTQRYLVE